MLLIAIFVVATHQIKGGKLLKFKIRQLEAFRAVAESGSITKAAQQLGISQPASGRRDRRTASVQSREEADRSHESSFLNQRRRSPRL